MNRIESVPTTLQEMNRFRVAASCLGYEAHQATALFITHILGTVLDQTGALSPPALPCKLSYCMFIA